MKGFPQMSFSTLKKRRFQIMAAVAAAGWGVALLGAATAPTKIAVVNSDKITNTSVEIKKLLTDASTGAEALSEQVRAKQAQYKTLSDRYNSQLSITSEEEKKRRADELKKLAGEIEELSFRFNREIKNAQDKAVEPLRERVVKAISDVARAGDYAVVISTENTIYYSPQVDLTSAVIARIDGKQ
jgi:outer membrane protein